MTRARDIANLGNNTTNLETIDTVYSAGGLTGRNLIINGAMTVAQRGTSATFNSTGGAYQTVDRFRFAGSRSEYVATLSQASDAPSGFGYSYKVATTTAETALDAADQLNIQYRIEGQNLQHLNKGSSDAKKLTLSFWVKSSVATTWSVNLVDNDNTRTIAATYTTNATNTWEYKTITFAGDTTGTLDNDNARSLDLKFWLDGGTTYTSGTLATAWEASTNANSQSATTGFMTTASSTWQITGVQLEVGETATPFEHEDYGTTLRKCQRYYFQYDGIIYGQAYGGVYTMGNVNNPVTMRAQPTYSASANPSSFTLTPSGKSLGYILQTSASNIGNGVTNLAGNAEL